MENPTLERMEAWRDQATERLSLFARSNAIEEPIGIGEECYQLGEDCYKPDRYDQFRWVTEDQFDSVLPPGIEHDRYIAMTNMTGFDDEIKEWSANWNDPGYWHDAAADALWSSNDGAYWTTRDEDPSDAVMARAVYGQINVYGVTTKSERHKRSYWTRTADGNGIGGRKAPVPYGS